MASTGSFALIVVIVLGTIALYLSAQRRFVYIEKSSDFGLIVLCSQSCRNLVSLSSGESMCRIA